VRTDREDRHACMLCLNFLHYIDRPIYPDAIVCMYKHWIRQCVSGSSTVRATCVAAWE
jgi:hypothetical protein